MLSPALVGVSLDIVILVRTKILETDWFSDIDVSTRITQELWSTFFQIGSLELGLWIVKIFLKKQDVRGSISVNSINFDLI